MSQDPRVTAARQWWLESLSANLDAQRADLRARSGSQVTALAGAAWDGEHQVMRLLYWGASYTIAWPMIDVADTAGQPARIDAAAVILAYLQRADGTPLAGRWVSFRELPDAGFYHQAFDGYTGHPLVEGFADTPDRLRTAASALGGWPEPVGEIGFAFQALPRIRVAVAWWAGDEDLSPQARILFDAAASHYLDAAGLAGVGGHLSRKLLAISGQLSAVSSKS